MQYHPLFRLLHFKHTIVYQKNCIRKIVEQEVTKVGVGVGIKADSAALVRRKWKSDFVTNKRLESLCQFFFFLIDFPCFHIYTVQIKICCFHFFIRQGVTNRNVLITNPLNILLKYITYLWIKVSIQSNGKIQLIFLQFSYIL